MKENEENMWHCCGHFSGLVLPPSAPIVPPLPDEVSAPSRPPLPQEEVAEIEEITLDESSNPIGVSY